MIIQLTRSQMTRTLAPLLASPRFNSELWRGQAAIWVPRAILRATLRGSFEDARGYWLWWWGKSVVKRELRPVADSLCRIWEVYPLFEFGLVHVLASKVLNMPKHVSPHMKAYFIFDQPLNWRLTHGIFQSKIKFHGKILVFIFSVNEVSNMSICVS